MVETRKRGEENTTLDLDSFFETCNTWELQGLPVSFTKAQKSTQGILGMDQLLGENNFTNQKPQKVEWPDQCME